MSNKEPNASESPLSHKALASSANNTGEQVARLKKLYELSMLLSGDPTEIFIHVARTIGELLDVKVVCLSEIRGQELAFLCVYVDGQIYQDAGACSLNITPCSTVEESKDIRIYDRVTELFPEASFLKDHNAFSYCGFPALSNAGEVVAVTCLLDDKPHKFSEDDLDMLRIFGQRIGMELERQKILLAREEDKAELKIYQHKLEKLVQEKTATMNEALKSAEYANKAKTEFIARMSHELRTPLNAILGFGQILELDSEDLSQTQMDYVRGILEGGRHILNLANEVLDLAKIESGKIEIIMDEVHLGNALKEAITLIQPQANNRQIVFIDHVSHMDLSIHADPKCFKQVLLNLLSNAVKYNNENGRITLNCEIIDKQRLRICVSDTGDGLSETEIEKLYMPYERLDADINIEGTGIGLVITNTLAELMGGATGVFSTKGEGSTFWVELALSNGTI